MRGLQPRLTALATALVALVSALLLWLGWLLVGGVNRAVPAFPPGTTVRVDGLDVPAERLGSAFAAAAQAEVLRAGLVAFPLVVAAAAVVSWVLVGRVLGPLHAVSAAARRLSVESLDTRIGPSGASEVRELAAAFDAMLDRLQAAFDAQRRFVANASHELRTPLAVLRTEVDVTLADPAADVAELRRMGAVVRDATRRADDLVAALLLLAQTQAAAPGPVDLTVDLAATVAPALAALDGEVAAAGLRVRVRAAPVTVRGDAVLLERVTGNLVENAVRHNVAGGWVEVDTAARDGTAQLRVSSSGREVAADRVAELFEPFRRGERTARTPGAGLGLSIVRAVVVAHGGTVAADPVPGGGLTVTVHLPVIVERLSGSRGAG